MIFTVGDKFRDKDYLYHIVNIFSDNSETLIVYKFYGKHIRKWHYEIKNQESLKIEFAAGLKRFKKERVTK